VFVELPVVPVWVVFLPTFLLKVNVLEPGRFWSGWPGPDRLEAR
jgi:hypothetical protein